MDRNSEIRKPNIYQRINAVQQEIDFVQKEKKQGMRYSIVSHDAVTAKVRPLMVKHGIVYYPLKFKMEQVGNRTQLICQVAFQNIDDVTDRMLVDTAGFGIDDQDKGPGKAISYAVKYALLKALGLESGDDPDEDQETISKPSITDASRQKVEEFKSAVVIARTMDDLNELRLGIKPIFESLAAEFPAYVQEATTVWQRKAAAVKKATENAPA